MTACLAALSLAAIASRASAAVTIGSNLAREPNFGIQDLGSLQPTFAQAALPAGSQAPDGVVSPVNGTVTYGRVRVGSSSSPIAFRVIRHLGGSVFTGAGTSATLSPGANATIGFNLQLPIQIGDLVGVDCCLGAAGSLFVDPGVAANVMHAWTGLADGGPGLAPGFSDNREVTINADVEPTSQFGLSKPKLNKKRGTATLTVEVPNPGKLTASGKGVKSASVGAAVISKKVGAAGKVKLVIKAKGKQKKKLKQNGKVGVKPKITFTPTGGEPATRTQKLSLKRKLKER